MQSFTDLKAWQVGMELVEEIYRITSNFPSDEKFGLTSQLRRAVTSIVANVAEGFGRYTFADKAHKYTISRGECAEVKAFLLIAIRVGYLDENQTQKSFDLVNQTGKLLSGLISASKSRR